MRTRFTLVAVIAAFALVIAACGSDDADTTTTTVAPATTEAPPTTVLELAASAGQFNTLAAAVDAAGLTDTLSGEGPFTVFAPTDEAFAAAFAALGIEPAALLADTELLTSILTYHVIGGQAVESATVVTLDGQSVETVNGSSVAISVDGSSVMVDGANVVTVDLAAQNGIVHVIDAVLLPADVAAALAAPAETTTTTTTMPEADPTIAEIVIDAAAADEAEFSILLAAVQAADPAVVELLSDPAAEVTVFAPTDAAFGAALDALGVSAEDLLANTELLTSILTYHVIDGVVPAETALTLDGAEVETLNAGNFLTITIDNGVFLNNNVDPLGGSEVIDTDIFAANGVIHVIDTVLINNNILHGG